MCSNYFRGETRSCICSVLIGSESVEGCRAHERQKLCEKPFDLLADSPHSAIGSLLSCESPPRRHQQCKFERPRNSYRRRSRVIKHFKRDSIYFPSESTPFNPYSTRDWIPRRTLSPS